MLKIIIDHHFHHHDPNSMQSIGAAEAVPRLQSLSGHHSGSESQGRNLGFGYGAGDSTPTLCEGHCGIFNGNELMPADGTPNLTSIQGTAHTLTNHPACETPGYQL